MSYQDADWWRREFEDSVQRERRKERVAVELAELLQYASLPPAGVRILDGLLATNHWLRDELERRRMEAREKE